MVDYPRYWLLYVFAFPVIHFYYYAAVLNSFIDLEETDLTYWSYSILAFGGGAIIAFFGPESMSVPLEFDPLFLLLVPLGIGLYFVETYVWYRYTGKPIEVARESIESMVPVPFVSFPEEIVYRVGAWPLVSILGVPGYVVTSGLLFGFHHYAFSKRDVLLKSFDGMIYAALFWYTGSIWASTMMHTGYNVASVYVIADYRHVPVLRRIAPGPQ